MKIFKIFSFIILLFILSACDGGINNITVNQDGYTSFNPPIKDVKTPTPTTVPKPTIAPTTPKPTPAAGEKITPSNPTTKGVLPSLPGIVPIQVPSEALPGVQLPGTTIPIPTLPSSSSILDGLPDLSKSVDFTQREPFGMPKINGEKISGDVYGSDILVIRYTRKIINIKYSDDINNISSVGLVEAENAKLSYPVSFVNIYFKDDDGKIQSRIFGIVKIK